jgi:ribosomal protein L18E
VISHQKHYFVKYYSDSKHKYSEVEIKKMLDFLIDNDYVVVGGQVFQQSVEIPMGMNCAPLLADLILYSY